jgi:hypothetical protein
MKEILEKPLQRKYKFTNDLSNIEKKIHLPNFLQLVYKVL